jgi:hypothetical protein
MSNVFLLEPDTVRREMKERGMIGSAKRKELKAVKQWNFLTSHALVLLFVTKHRRSGRGGIPPKKPGGTNGEV